MKVLILKDPLWELLLAKLKCELDQAQNAVAWARAWELQYNIRHYNMSRLRKRRLEAARLVREISKQ